MIHYEISSSRFYEMNKSYCNHIEQSLKLIGVECSGFCNSYGYEIAAKINRNQFSYQLNFFKSQSTQNGVIVPVDALDNSGLKIEASGFRKENHIEIGKSVFKRMFMSNTLKSLVSEQQYLITNLKNDDEQLNLVIDLFNRHEMYALNLLHGKFNCYINCQVEEINSLLDNLESIDQ